MKAFNYLTLIVLLAGCDKAMGPAPVANFTVDGVTSGALIPIYTHPKLIDNSQNATAYLWDFGDGTTSTDKVVTLNYSNAGKYTVVLTVTNADGKKSMASQDVIIANVILKQVAIESVNLHPNLAGWYNFGPSADVWIEIVKGDANTTYNVLADGIFDAPLVYKSEVVTVSSSTSMPIVFNVPNKVIVDVQALSGLSPYVGIGYGINLYGKDASGTYLMSSNFWSGVMIYTFNISTSTRSFDFRTGILNNSVACYGSFE